MPEREPQARPELEIASLHPAQVESAPEGRPVERSKHNRSAPPIEGPEQ
jgi:hypothetical protein